MKGPSAVAGFADDYGRLGGRAGQGRLGCEAGGRAVWAVRGSGTRCRGRMGGHKCDPDPALRTHSPAPQR